MADEYISRYADFIRKQLADMQVSSNIAPGRSVGKTRETLTESVRRGQRVTTNDIDEGYDAKLSGDVEDNVSVSPAEAERLRKKRAARLASKGGFVDKTRRALKGLGTRGLNFEQTEYTDDEIVETIDALIDEGYEPDQIRAALYCVLDDNDNNEKKKL